MFSVNRLTSLLLIITSWLIKLHFSLCYSLLCKYYFYNPSLSRALLPARSVSQLKPRFLPSRSPLSFSVIRICDSTFTLSSFKSVPHPLLVFFHLIPCLQFSFSYCCCHLLAFPPFCLDLCPPSIFHLLFFPHLLLDFLPVIFSMLYFITFYTSFRSFPTSLSLFIPLFYPRLDVWVSLFVLSSHWNISSGCPKLLTTTVNPSINIACLCFIDHDNARNTELATRHGSCSSGGLHTHMQVNAQAHACIITSKARVAWVVTVKGSVAQRNYTKLRD